MPRPNLSPKRPGAAAAQSRNPISNWLANRKERRAQIEDEASRMITNKIAQNENIIIDKLNSINFEKSRLPRKVLDYKTNPDQPCGDLEYAVQFITYMLRKNPQIIKMDIRKFDQKLLTLVLLFKQTVEQGDTEAAYAAKGGIARAVTDIRSRIPQEQPELAKMFVDSNTEYLDQWITLVLHAQLADKIKRNVENLRENQERDKVEYDNKVEKLKEQIDKEDNLTVAFEQILNRTHTEDRANWTEDERKIHQILVEHRMEKVNLDINGQLLQQQEVYLKTIEGQVNLLSSHVAILPDVTDPDRMNKFQESVDILFKKMYETDAQIDTALKIMDDIEGRLQQINRAPGSIRAKEVAAEEAERVLAEMKALQDIKTGDASIRAKRIREDMGLLTEEQVAEKQKQLAEQRLKEQMEAQEREREREQEQERLLN